MNKVLIIHHVESMWELGLKKFGTCLETVVVDLAYHLSENEYDYVYLTRLEGNELEYETEPLAPWVDRVEEYGYGWSRYSINLGDEDDLPNDWIEGGSHSEIVYVPDWIKQLKNSVVDLCGAFRGECLEDMEIALEASGADWKYLDHLCTG